MEDSLIIDLYLERRESAITETSQKYGKRLRALSYRITEDFPSAEECENDTYLKAWTSIPPHEPRSYLFPFLARITRNLSLNLCRDRDRLKRRAFLTELDTELEQCIPSPNDLDCLIDDLAFKQVINSFLASLEVEKRAVFLRRYWYLDSVTEISRQFGISESKVKTTLFRCRNRFRSYLEKEGYQL